MIDKLVGLHGFTDFRSQFRNAFMTRNPNQEDDVSHLGRIADALERIATKLEEPPNE